MNNGQMTIDFLVAVMLSLFLITWIQGFISVQSNQIQRFGVTQETAQASISVGSVINTFYAMNPGSNDYARALDPEIRGFLKETNYDIQKSPGDDQVVVSTRYGGNQTSYYRLVVGDSSYSQNCSETGGLPCVEG